MKRAGRTRAGFTLIELLVVIGIIAVLVALLIPTISAAMLMAHRSVTKSTLNELALSLKAFKADFGDYPPSRPRVPLTGTKTDPASGELATGAANLVYYLRGPGGSGWGMGGGGVMPFPGQKPRSHLRTLRHDPPGPYRLADRQHAASAAGFPGFLLACGHHPLFQV